MASRKPELQTFVDAVRAGFQASRMDRETNRCVRDTFALLTNVVRAVPGVGRRLPACASLPQALVTASSTGSALAMIVTAFETLEPSLTWNWRDGGSTASANFPNGHANAMVIGPGGLENRDDVWLGVSLLAPQVRYPDHQHPPEEVYLALSPGEFRQADKCWFEPGIGGTFFNEPGIIHAMRSGPVPLLAIWCLRPGKAS